MNSRARSETWGAFDLIVFPAWGTGFRRHRYGDLFGRHNQNSLARAAQGGKKAPARGPRHDHPEPTPPSNLIAPYPATILSNPNQRHVVSNAKLSRSARREPRSLNLETLSTIHGSKSVDHGPRCLDLGPRTLVQDSGFRIQARYQYIDLRQAKRNACKSGALRLP